MNGIKPLNVLASTLLCAVLVPSQADARIYTWVDEHGKTHYGDKVPSRYRTDSSRVKLQDNRTEVPDIPEFYRNTSSTSANRSGKGSAVKSVSDANKINRNKNTKHYRFSKHKQLPTSESKSRHDKRTRHRQGTRHNTQSRHAYSK